MRPVDASHSRIEWSQLAEKTWPAVGHTSALMHAVCPAKLATAICGTHAGGKPRSAR